MFKLRPYGGLLLVAFFVLITGGLLTADAFTSDSKYVGDQRWLFILIVTLILTLLLVAAAFSRYGFSHLRHHRPGYKRG